MQNDRNNDTSTANHVGLEMSITIVGMNGDNPLRAKVDTGAEACSLHATNLEQTVDDISGAGTVKFSLGEYQYSLPIHGFQAISSADGGTVNRPTIRVGVRANEEYYPDIIFNLNDRSGMEYPVLLGSEFLKLAGLVVDPKLSEDLEIVFADDPEQKDQSQRPNVDVSGEIQDNTGSDLDVEALTAWFVANKSKTLGQIVTELLSLGTNPDVKD